MKSVIFGAVVTVIVMAVWLGGDWIYKDFQQFKLRNVLTGQEATPKVAPINEYAVDAPNLPTNAKNIKDIGNGWLTFQCEVEGRNRKFLFARYYVNGWKTGTITELKD